MRTIKHSERLRADTELLDYTDFADLAKIFYMLKSGLNLDSNYDDVASSLLKLAPSRNRVCHSRPLEESDFPELYDFANLLITKHKDLKWSQLQTVLSRLGQDPSYVLHLTIPSFWSVDSPKILNNLPLPEFDDTGFLGRIADRQEVT